VRLPIGESRRGGEVATEILTHRRRLHPPPAPDPADAPRAPVAYEAMNSVHDATAGAALWLNTQRDTGRGEGSSGLAFDFLVDTLPRP
jgi:hypothetical protein